MVSPGKVQREERETDGQTRAGCATSVAGVTDDDGRRHAIPESGTDGAKRCGHISSRGVEVGSRRKSRRRKSLVGSLVVCCAAALPPLLQVCEIGRIGVHIKQTACLTSRRTAGEEQGQRREEKRQKRGERREESRERRSVQKRNPTKTSRSRRVR